MKNTAYLCTAHVLSSKGPEDSADQFLIGDINTIFFLAEISTVAL